MNKPFTSTFVDHSFEPCIFYHKYIPTLRKELDITNQFPILNLILKQYTELIFIKMGVGGLVEGQELD
jgi:hypothetical protein